MQEQTDNGASVIMLRGHGEDRLRQAMQQSLVAKDLQSDVEEVLKDIAKARFDLDVANKLLEDERRSYYRFEKLYHQCVLAKQKEDMRKKRFDNIKGGAILFGMVFIVVLLCMMICRVIFG
mgnify:CR=1 FL=1